MAIDVVVEEVADNLEEIADATRRINTNSVGFFLGGVAIGAAVGFYFGYRFNKEKIKAELFQESEKEVAKIRELYQQKSVAAAPKPSLDEVIQEQGYERPLKAPVPGLVEPTVSAPPRESDWDWATEIEKRTNGEPYVIHQDEYRQNETGYSQVTYTYYVMDDTLVDEENEHPLPHADIIVGLNNLQFGHGTDDIDVVFVRNDARELEMEICRLHESYEEKVLGLENSDDDDDSDDD
jgi:hypothetical protein